MKRFPTDEAMELADLHHSVYNDQGSRVYPAQIAEDIHEAGLHIDDWGKAFRQLQGIDPNAEDGETLGHESMIWEVEEAYTSQAYDAEKPEERQLRRSKQR